VPLPVQQATGKRQLATGNRPSAGCVIVVWPADGRRPDSDWFFNDGAEHIKQVDNVIPSASAGEHNSRNCNDEWSGDRCLGLWTSRLQQLQLQLELQLQRPFLAASTHKKDHFACLGPIHPISLRGAVLAHKAWLSGSVRLRVFVCSCGSDRPQIHTYVGIFALAEIVLGQFNGFAGGNLTNYVVYLE